MDNVGVNYFFGQNTQNKVTYPYWVGETSVMDIPYEDGMETHSIILTGFARGNYMTLIDEFDKIKNHFKHTITANTSSGAVVVFALSDCIPNIPTGDMELKRAEIKLTVNYWSTK